MSRHIQPQHQRAIDRLVGEYQNDDQFLALIIGGSVAKGCARPDSDVDFMIVATDEVYDRQKKVGDLFINRTDLCDYPGGFVDGKVISRQYLTDVEAKGNEPSRAAFDGAILAFSRDSDLDRLIERIPTYPTIGHEQKLKSFYSMAFIQNWLMGEANRHDNLYTRSRAASQLVLHAGRLILAHNRVLFPYHKWFEHYLGKCTARPEGLLDQMHRLLKSPDKKHAETLFTSIQEFHPWGVSDHEAFMWFMEEVEWSWMHDAVPLEDL